MLCSVLIVNWRTPEHLASLLESLRAYPASGAQEVIVVDNDPEYFDVDSFRQRFPEVMFLPQAANLGFAAGNNVAYASSRGEYLVLLNPDTEVTEGALDSLIAFLKEHPAAGIVSPQLILPDGSVQDSCRQFPYPLGILWVALRLHRMFPKSRTFGAYRMTYFDHQTTREVDQPMASCWVMPRKVIEEVGFFDEDFPILFNDVDLAWRVKQAGWEIWFTADAQVKHVGAQGTKRAGQRIIRESHEGLVKFYRKNFRGKVAAPLLGLGMAISYGNFWIRTLLAKRCLRG